MLVNPFLRAAEKLYGLLVLLGSNLQSLLLLYMRLTWGHQLFWAGNNLFEAVLGIFLWVGLASRLAAIPLIILMLTALGTLHAEELAGFQVILNPHSLVNLRPYPFLITGLMVLIFGPGRISLDAWIKRWIGKQPRY